MAPTGLIGQDALVRTLRTRHLGTFGGVLEALRERNSEAKVCEYGLGRQRWEGVAVVMLHGRQKG